MLCQTIMIHSLSSLPTQHLREFSKKNLLRWPDAPGGISQSAKMSQAFVHVQLTGCWFWGFLYSYLWVMIRSKVFKQENTSRELSASVCWQRWGLCNSEKCTSTHTPYSQVDCSPALAANIHEPYSVCLTSNRAGCGLTCKYQIHIILCGANVCHH